MLKQLLLKYALPMVSDALVEALYKLAKKSANGIDDKIVDAIADNKQIIIAEVKASVKK